MAEALSSSEIEDVLSSIRRLVAQDLKPADRARLAAVTDISQKLVLAPENRIEDRGNAGQEDEDTSKFITVRRPTRRAAFPAIDEVLPSMDAAADGASDRSDWSLGAEAEFTAPKPIEFTGDTRLSDVAPEEFANQVAYAAQDDTLESGDVPDGDMEMTDPAPQDQTNHDAGSDSAHDDTWADETDDYEDNRAEPEQSVHGTIEPDEDWANEAEARVIAELAGEAVEETIVQAASQQFREPNFSRKAAPEVLYDEDTLRQLVQTIFREEMAGPMGERITRNIRKLVRAEVGRMLAVQELE